MSSLGRFNKLLIESNGSFSCYHCGQIDKVTNHTFQTTDRGETLLCPYCGVDALLHGVYTKERLGEIYELCFDTSMDLSGD